MRNNTKSVKLIVKLLRQTSSLAIVSEFLKAKGLTHSASSWDEMENKRIIPAINSKRLNIQDLIELLRNVEEYGHQHVFLYKCIDPSDAAILMGQERVNSIMSKCGLADLIKSPKVLDQPQSPEISDIRLEPVSSEKAHQFIIKIIETRKTEELISESENSKGDILTKRWKIKKERAINLFKLNSDGLLELRITSQSNSARYKSKVDMMWNIVEDFLPKDKFKEISLSNAKKTLWNDRNSLQDKIRFSDVTLKNDTGNTIKAATGSPVSSLYEDAGINSSMEAFVAHDAYCDSHNVWFKITSESDQDKSREIHVLLSGEVNEFAITANCSSQEYEYVYDQLRNFNK
jgi:hypothetical protein